MSPHSQAAGPESDYLLYCGGCHLRSGAGIPPDIPDLRRDMDRFARSRLGRDYPVRVPGSAQADLTDAELAAVLNWMLDRFYTKTEDIARYTGDEVGRYRASTLADPLAYRAALLLRMEAD